MSLDSPLSWTLIAVQKKWEANGRPNGRPVGRPDGRLDGRPVGRLDGRPVGRLDGRPTGRPNGRPVGRPDGYYSSNIRGTLLGVIFEGKR